MTYKALQWSVLPYAASAWFPTITTESMKRLKITQNAAARIVTECHLRVSLDRLHAKTQLLGLYQSLGLLCSDYLAKALRHIRPFLPIISQPTNEAPKQHTLNCRFLLFVSPYLTNGTIKPTDYRDLRNDPHHQTVQSAIQNQSPNPILHEKLLVIHTVKKLFFGHTAQPFHN